MLKVLFIHNFAYPDYLSNLVYMGLSNLENVELHTYAVPAHLLKDIGWYDKIHTNSLFGPLGSKTKGFTLCGKITKAPIVNWVETIRQNIKEKLYDKVIYSSVWRDRTFFSEVTTYYKKEDIILIDGDDHELIFTPALNYGVYFKREFEIPDENIKPISFAIPDYLLELDTIPDKTKYFAYIVPGDLKTYIYKDEEPYFKDYRESYFGITFKKGGWDALRHYEIIGNRCIPYFKDLENCPVNCLHNFPKEIILHTNEYARLEQIPPDYNKLNEELYNYAKKYMTTTALANYILS